MELELIAFIASTIGIGGCLPQIIKIIKTKDTTALSYGKYAMGVFAGLLWVYYGLLAPMYSIVFWNSISTLMAITVLLLKYRNEHRGMISIRTFSTKTGR